ncbi:hypothetical protein BAY61_11730 [Prauserella marina]|uniref:Uncharacterized protein n=1 Tax=Prauserella marina TaxID=530584 RepID=A0A222VNV2_9PSEU|nr:hypothetical protein [Prauserella marina]ASR35554.1 hypothetical protein BAY61_11730 [Prauserella marina]PWV84602.1 hypothetical protein DES30_101619 [Prauserella marina]SDC18002.1 hypothetical protein SAMN05421630_101717 [Prauserella marina]
MRTLKFLGMWAKMTLVAILAMVVEIATITTLWILAPVAAITVLAWAAVTAGMWREWRAHATGYTHQITDLRRERV